MNRITMFFNHWGLRVVRTGNQTIVAVTQYQWTTTNGSTPLRADIRPVCHSGKKGRARSNCQRRDKM